MINYFLTEQTSLSERDLRNIRKEAKKKSGMSGYRILDIGKIENNLFVLACCLKNDYAVLQLKLFKVNKKVEGIIATIYQKDLTEELIIENILCNK